MWQSSGPDTVRCRVGLERGDRVLQESRHKLLNTEGHLKLRDVKMPIAVNSPASDRTGTLGAAVRCTTQPRGGGKTRINERFLVLAPLNRTWNHSCLTSLSKLTTIGGEPVADHVRTSLDNEIWSRERVAVRVKSEKSEARDTRDSDSEVHPTKKLKTTRGLLEELVLSTRSDARADKSPRPTKGAASMEIEALKEAHATESVHSRRSIRLPSRRHCLRSAGSITTSSRIS